MDFPIGFTALIIPETGPLKTAVDTLPDAGLEVPEKRVRFRFSEKKCNVSGWGFKDSEMPVES
jgi:hypothetical protein